MIGMRVLALGRCLGAALLATAGLAAQDTAPGNQSIRATDLEADVRFLAGDGMAGRLTDTDGNRQAAEFISSRFARLGLSAVGSDGTHFHRFDLMTTRLGGNNRLRLPDLPQQDRQLGDEFYPDPAPTTITREQPDSASSTAPTTTRRAWPA